MIDGDADLRQRLAVLEDQVAINDLMVEYNLACDEPLRKGERVAACFTEDGVWESIGVHGNPAWAAAGRAALAIKFDRNIERMPFSAHFLVGGTVRVAGDEASGSWRYFQSATYRDGRALWIAGCYFVEFRRRERSWLIERLRVENYFTTPYEAGWAEMAHVDTP
jgi:hypothetical protein